MTNGQIYHVCNKSIAGFVIFNNDSEYMRMKNLIKYYQLEDPPTKFSYFMSHLNEGGDILNLDLIDRKNKLINIIAYCLMPTHIHLVLQQLKDNGISIFMSNILNGYTRYFNIRHKRKGPLWVGRFKRVVVSTDEQLLHLTRYVHLNPVTSYLIEKPESWTYGSYNEYCSQGTTDEEMCCYENILDIDSKSYKNFVNDRKEYQRELAKIKELMLE
ncbi:transposase [PVC group bacterium]|nr:transposase [PVC group bacterium]